MGKASILGLPLLLLSCGDFFGRKTRLDFIEVPQYDNALIAYVPLLPYWEGFEMPTDFCIGYDELIYVADSGAGQIICLDQAGRRLGSFRLPGVHAVAQDRRLDLLAAAPKDTLIGGQLYRLEAIYRIRLAGSQGYGLAQARIVNTLVHPFYFKSTFALSDTAVRFRRIKVLGDNSYLVTRNGRDNDPAKFGGPDDAVLRFRSTDEWQEAITVQTSTGERPDFFQGVWGLAVPAHPPQSPFVSRRENFWVGLTAPGLPIKIHAIVPKEGEQGQFYESEARWAPEDPRLADGFITTPGRLGRPEGLAITTESRPYLVVADAEKDSVYVFTLSGLEGVLPPGLEGVVPPPAASSRRPVRVSFGGRGKGPLQLNRPTAVAHYKKVLYVLDAGNKRMLRLRLTTDF